MVKVTDIIEKSLIITFSEYQKDYTELINFIQKILLVKYNQLENYCDFFAQLEELKNYLNSMKFEEENGFLKISSQTFVNGSQKKYYMLETLEVENVNATLANFVCTIMYYKYLFLENPEEELWMKLDKKSLLGMYDEFNKLKEESIEILMKDRK